MSSPSVNTHEKQKVVYLPNVLPREVFVGGVVILRPVSIVGSASLVWAVCPKLWPVLAVRAMLCDLFFRREKSDEYRVSNKSCMTAQSSPAPRWTWTLVTHASRSFVNGATVFGTRLPTSIFPCEPHETFYEHDGKETSQRRRIGEDDDKTRATYASGLRKLGPSVLVLGVGFVDHGCGGAGDTSSSRDERQGNTSGAGADVPIPRGWVWLGALASAPVVRSNWRIIEEHHAHAHVAAEILELFELATALAAASGGVEGGGQGCGGRDEGYVDELHLEQSSLKNRQHLFYYDEIAIATV